MPLNRNASRVFGQRSIVRAAPCDAIEPNRQALGESQRRCAYMGRQVAVVLYVVTMAALIVAVDFVFFRNRFWERLTVNIGIVLVFVAFYLRFFGRP